MIQSTKIQYIPHLKIVFFEDITVITSSFNEKKSYAKSISNETPINKISSLQIPRSKKPARKYKYIPMVLIPSSECPITYTASPIELATKKIHANKQNKKMKSVLKHLTIPLLW